MRLLKNKCIFALFVFVVFDSSLSFGDQSGCAGIFDTLAEIDQALEGNQEAQEALKKVTRLIQERERYIKEVEKKLEVAEENSLTDPLTNLPNLRALNERIPEIISRVQRERIKKQVWILMMDGDKFKSINDTFGHEVGDEYLKTLGNTLKKNFRENEYIFRKSGDEFIGVIITESHEEALVVAKRVLREVQTASWPREIAMTLTIGMRPLELDVSKFPEALKEADHAMYWLKRNGGRGKIKIFGEDGYHEAILSVETDS